jgi:hypothetical protein
MKRERDMDRKSNGRRSWEMGEEEEGRSVVLLGGTQVRLLAPVERGAVSK